jgi:hypothetical protein
LRGIDLMHKASNEDFVQAKQVLEMSSERDPTPLLHMLGSPIGTIFHVAIGASLDPHRDSSIASIPGETGA